MKDCGKSTLSVLFGDEQFKRFVDETIGTGRGRPSSKETASA
jgi:hypothetical protein